MYIAAKTFKQGEITHNLGDVVHNPTNEMLEKGHVLRDSSIVTEVAPVAPKAILEIVEPVEPVEPVQLLIEDSADITFETTDVLDAEAGVISVSTDL